jgi:hypothetical protein
MLLVSRLGADWFDLSTTNVAPNYNAHCCLLRHLRPAVQMCRLQQQLPGSARFCQLPLAQLQQHLAAAAALLGLQQPPLLRLNPAGSSSGSSSSTAGQQRCLGVLYVSLLLHLQVLLLLLVWLQIQTCCCCQILPCAAAD